MYVGGIYGVNERRMSLLLSLSLTLFSSLLSSLCIEASVEGPHRWSLSLPLSD